MATLTDNWFAAGEAIQAQLQAAVPTLRSVGYAPALNVLGKLLTMPTPAAYVVPGALSGSEPPRQTWYVAIHARNVANLVQGEGLMNEAGALISQVLAALAHFVPGPEFGPLFLPSEDHHYPDVGQGVYVLTYATLIEPEFWPLY